MGEVITSTTNPRVKRLVGLADRRNRDNEGLFLVEGTRAVERFLAAGRQFVEFYVGRDWLNEHSERLVETVAETVAETDVDIVQLGKDAFAKCAYRERPEGVLGVARQWSFALDDLKLSADALILVAEGVEKPGNLGSMLRSADAAGCEAVMLCDSVVDRFNPNVVRSSTGVLFTLPIVEVTSQEILAFLRAQNIRSVATTPDAASLIYDLDLCGRTAIVVGAEDVGLSDGWLRESDHQVKLPMLGAADSLNVAMATVIALYEAVRQRHHHRA